jgi:signal transduction histidine kinase
MDHVIPEEQRFILSRLSPSRAQIRLALGCALALLVGFAATEGPLSHIRTTRIDGFVPAYGTAIVVIDAVTAALLFAQFSILRNWNLLVIATAYLYTAFIGIPWMLTFPGVFAPHGLLGAGLQTTDILYILWHAGFPVFVTAYALLKRRGPPLRVRGPAGRAILASVALTAVVVCALTIFIIKNDRLMPDFATGLVHFSALWNYVAIFLLLCCCVAFVTLWVRRSSVLDLWLLVVLFASVIEIVLISFPVLVRFSATWYLARAFSLVASSLVLFVLIYEIMILYAELFRAVFAERREREARLITGEAISAAVAHELRQPLTGIMTNAHAAVRWLDRTQPDLDEATAALNGIVATGHRATAVLESIRAIFRKGDIEKEPLEVNELVSETLTLVRADLQRYRVSADAQIDGQLLPISGNRIQLQQVLLNLIGNAIHAMSDKDGPRILRVSVAQEDGNILVSVADSGAGISEHDVERLFNPLFTTKSGGMGMGLAICRSIVEAHQGRIWVVPNKPEGAVFQFTLNASPTTHPQ